MAKKYKCTEYSSRKRTILLCPEINEQDFLTLLCWHYEEAARFVLDWGFTNIDVAAQFMAKFFVHVHRDVYVDAPHMNSRHPENPGLQSPGASFCSVAFHRFCELLHENNELVCLIRDLPVYIPIKNKKADILGKRETNWISLTRGTSWQASSSFKNPNPIPKEILASFQREQQEQKRRDEPRFKLEEEARAREKEKKKKKRYRMVAIKQMERKEKSEKRKAFRDHFITLSIETQLRMLATETEIPITVFPIDPRSITDDALRQLDDFILAALVDRSSKRWEVWWKEFTARSRKILKYRETPPTG